MNNCDPSGHFAIFIPIIAVVAIVAVVAIAATYYFSTPEGQRSWNGLGQAYSQHIENGINALENAASAIQSFANAANNVMNTHDNSVYVLKDPGDGNKVKYVGITNNVKRRKAEHKKTDKAKYEMTVITTGLTRPQARLMEQATISAFTLKHLDNARREIAVGNVKGFQSSMGAIVSIFDGVAEDEMLNLMGR